MDTSGKVDRTEPDPAGARVRRDERYPREQEEELLRPGRGSEEARIQMAAIQTAAAHVPRAPRPPRGGRVGVAWARRTSQPRRAIKSM